MVVLTPPDSSQKKAALVTPETEKPPEKECRWPSVGPAVPTASVPVVEKCKLMQIVAYNFSTMRLCRRCLLSERHMARRTEAQPRTARQLSAEVKADYVAVLERQAAGQYMVDVL